MCDGWADRHALLLFNEELEFRWRRGFLATVRFQGTDDTVSTSDGDVEIIEIEIGEPIRTADGSTGTVTSLAIVTD